MCLWNFGELAMRWMICAALAAATLPMHAAAQTVDFADVQAGVLSAWAEPEGSTATEEQILESVNYTAGMMTYVLYHEFGHGLISELKIPVIGTEEDSVDTFAAIYMIADDEDPILDEMIGSVVQARFDADVANNGYAPAWDSHSPSEQRAYQVVCMLVGADYEGWKEFATEAEMPEQRQKDCAWEYKKAVEGWDTLLGDHELDEGETSPGTVTVTYEDPTPEHELIAGIIMASGIGEAVSQQIESQFSLPNDIAVIFMNCGERNAYWYPAERAVKFCYEYAEFMRSNSITFRGQN